jgi:hypothetical protein
MNKPNKNDFDAKNDKLYMIETGGEQYYNETYK